jgi:4-alpha-glucanotransferase
VNASRSSGILLHPTSLPGGRLGPEAERFVDWLAAAGQSWWQMLPLGPPDEHRSPYKASSAFAAWDGLLADPDAKVSGAERDALRRRQGFWLADWEAFAGDGAVDDQVRFEREWTSLRGYAARRGVRLIGDVPIYVAEGSADHVAHPEIFQTGVVAGAPPDPLAETGQHWGNPLYDWPALQRRGYRWWTERFRRTFDLFDLARVDHFRGFVAYWSIPASAPDASFGRWRRGPGRAPFDAARRELGRLPLIAEDLGVITPPVHRLRDSLRLPGMAVVMFGFDGDPASLHVIANHPKRGVAYTGTHDNDTLRGWWENGSSEEQRSRALATVRAAGVEEPEPWWSLNRLALSSRCSLAVLQAQDVLGLGGEARMNVPGREGGNWSWALEAGQLDAALARRLRRATEAAGR